MIKRVLPTSLLPLLLCGLAAQVPAQIAAWPAGPGVEIGHEGLPGGLPAAFESSGIAWHPGRNSLLVASDSGLIAELPAGGGAPTVWSLPGDLEGLTIKDPASNLVYVGVESPDSIVEFNLATGSTTGNSWNLTTWMTGPSNEGLEALAYVNGEFWAGLQLNGNIFRFKLMPGGVVQFLGSMPSHLGRADLAGLEWDPCTGVVYALHDTANVLVEYDSNGTFLREYAATGTDQEGVALQHGSPTAAATIWFAQDTGEVTRYEGYPVTPCPPGTWTDLGGGTTGSAGAPHLAGSGPLQGGWSFALDLASAPPGAPMLAALSFASNPIAAFGGTFHALPIASQFILAADGGGGFHIASTWPAGVPSGTTFWFQFIVKDTAHTPQLTLSNGLRATAP